MRLFIGLELPPSVREALHALACDLPVGRPVPAENLHLTLHFVGEQDESVADALVAALSQAAGPSPPTSGVTLHLCGVGSFGDRPVGPPRGVWVAQSLSPALAALKARVDGLAESCGVEREHDGRVFTPHITITRFSSRPGRNPAHVSNEQREVGRFLRRNEGFELGPFESGPVTLFRSTLGSPAPTYRPLTSIPAAALLPIS